MLEQNEAVRGQSQASAGVFGLVHRITSLQIINSFNYFSSILPLKA